MELMKHNHKQQRVSLSVDELIHSCFDAIFIVSQLHIEHRYSIENANKRIQDQAMGNTRKVLLLTEYVNATVRIFNAFMTQKEEQNDG